MLLPSVVSLVFGGGNLRLFTISHRPVRPKTEGSSLGTFAIFQTVPPKFFSGVSRGEEIASATRRRQVQKAVTAAPQGRR